MNTKKLIITIMAGLILLTGVNAMAATDTNALTSTVSVAAICSISSVTNLDFGTYDTTSGVNDDDGNGDVSFSCTKGTAYDVYITGARTMTDGTDTLNFEMYTDAGRTGAWASASPGTTGTAADNTAITENVYGRIASGQDVQVGTYNGSVTMTVEY
jgi:spore coat protein U-like protein